MTDISTRLRDIASDLHEVMPAEGLTPDWDRIQPVLDKLHALTDEMIEMHRETRYLGRYLGLPTSGASRRWTPHVAAAGGEDETDE